MRATTHARRIAGGALALLLVGGLAACGDDDDGGSASAEACDAYQAITDAFNNEEGPETLNPLLDELDAQKPEQIEDELTVMIDAAREVAESGEFEAFETDEFMSAQNEVDPFLFEECDADEKLEVSAVDYEFEGVDDSIDSGKVAFLLTNEGDEPHEMIVFRKNDGVEESFEELFELEQEEAEEKVSFVTGAFALPDVSAAVWAELEPGDYAMACFVPVGTDPENPDEGGDGPPHFTEGMLQEFTVE